MSLFSNDIRVANTATPSFQQQANVSQFGWTGADQGHYNQLVQYVEECREIEGTIVDKVLFVEKSVERLNQVEPLVKTVTTLSEVVQSNSLSAEKAAALCSTSLESMTNSLERFDLSYQDFLDKYADFLVKYDEIINKP